MDDLELRAQQTEADGKNTDKEMTLEEAFAGLDGILERLEDRELPLEEAFGIYQRGMELLAQCNEKIDTVEKKVMVLNGDDGLEEL